MNALTNTATATVIKGSVLAEMNIEDMLAADMGSMELVTDFTPMPSGMYDIEVKTVEVTEVGAENKPAIKVEYSINGIVELADEADLELVGDLPRKHTEHYFLQGKNAYGLRSFVTIFKPVALNAGVNTVEDTLEAAIGSVGQALIEKRRYKDKNTGEMKESSGIVATQVSWS
jgi:hypothetical protein